MDVSSLGESMRFAVLTIVLALGTPSAQYPVPKPAKGSIKVIVREGDSGLPVEGAQVTVERSGATAVTDVSGTAEIPDLAAGSYRIRVTYNNQIDVADKVAQLTSVEMRQTVVKPGATSTLEFAIRRPTTLRGQVLTPDGRPVTSAPVAVLPVLRTFRGRPVLSSGPPDGRRATATTDADGRFAVGGLRPGRYFVRVALPAVNNVPLNYVYASGVTSTAAATAFALDSGDDVGVTVTAVAVPTIDVVGRVVDELGHRVEAAQIRVRALDGADSGNASIISDREGQFVLKSVRIGTYALQATRPTGGNDSIALVGATELEVGDKAVDPLEIKVVPGALIAGQILFNGEQQLDPGRTEIRVRADGDDADQREGLSPTPEWHADGSFAVSGVVGRHRLTLQSNANWFLERAFLEDGTDVADSSFNFQPGRIYRNVRVLLSNETAEITGKMPKGWAASPFMIVAFPEDSALWSDDRFVKEATASGAQTELTIKGIPPGRNYLVAIFVLPDRRDGPLVLDPPEFLQALVPAAARVFVDTAGKFTVNLPDPRR